MKQQSAVHLIVIAGVPKAEFLNPTIVVALLLLIGKEHPPGDPETHTGAVNVERRNAGGDTYITRSDGKWGGVKRAKIIKPPKEILRISGGFVMVNHRQAGDKASDVSENAQSFRGGKNPVFVFFDDPVRIPGLKGGENGL